MVCEYREEQVAEISKSLAPGRKYLFNAVVRGQDKEADRQVIAQLAVSVVNGTKDDPNGILECAKEFNAFDENKGRDYTITRRGKGLETRYTVTVASKPTPIRFKIKPVDLFTRLRKPLDAGEAETVLKGLKKKYER